VSVGNTLNNKSGLFFYGVNGPQAVAFQGGYLCVAAPTRRTAIQNSNGSALPAVDCSGSFSIDFNGYIGLGVDPALVDGQAVWGQFWSRDSAAASTTNLSNAIGFVIGM